MGFFVSCALEGMAIFRALRAMAVSSALGLARALSPSCRMLAVAAAEQYQGNHNNPTASRFRASSSSAYSFASVKFHSHPRSDGLKAGGGARGDFVIFVFDHQDQVVGERDVFAAHGERVIPFKARGQFFCGGSGGIRIPGGECRQRYA